MFSLILLSFFSFFSLSFFLSLLRQVWLRCSGAANCRAKTRLRHDELARCAEFCLQGKPALLQIEKDLVRTFPSNVFFNTLETDGVQRLRRILQPFAWMYAARLKREQVERPS